MGRRGFGQLDWEEAVRKADRKDRTFNPDAVRKVAIYLQETGYGIKSLAEDPTVSGLVITLMDFYVHTEKR